MNLCLYIVGAADGSEQNDKNMLDQVNAINTNLSVESNEKNTNEQKADNFSEPIESINNNNIHDKSKNLELQSKGEIHFSLCLSMQCPIYYLCFII